MRFLRNSPQKKGGFFTPIMRRRVRQQKVLKKMDSTEGFFSKKKDRAVTK
jgi:hypothetical protein